MIRIRYQYLPHLGHGDNSRVDNRLNPMEHPCLLYLVGILLQCSPGHGLGDQQRLLAKMIQGRATLPIDIVKRLMFLIPIALTMEWLPVEHHCAGTFTRSCAVHSGHQRAVRLHHRAAGGAVPFHQAPVRQQAPVGRCKQGGSSHIRGVLQVFMTSTRC